MIPDEILRELTEQNAAKIVLLVADGLGGVPHDGRTELEAADIPCLNKLASESELRADRPDRPRHHAGQRAVASGAVRLRPAEVRDRPRRARGARRGPLDDLARRGRAGELRHARKGPHRGPPRRPPRHREEPRALRPARQGHPQDRRRRGHHRAGQGAPLHRPVPRRRPRRPPGGRRPAAGRPSARPGQAARARKPSAPPRSSTISSAWRPRRSKAAARRTPSSCAASQSTRRSRAWPSASSSSRPASPPTRCTAAWPSSSG